jgi:hypothetical protein
MMTNDNTGPAPSGREPDSSASGLSATDVAIIEAMAGGLNQREAAGVAHVHPKTVQRKLADPGFAVLVAQRRGERVREITGQLTGVAAEAIAVIREAMQPENSMRVRLGAAQLALRNLAAYQAASEADAQIAELQQVAARHQALGEATDQ